MTTSKSEVAYALVSERIVNGAYSPDTDSFWEPSPRNWAAP